MTSQHQGPSGAQHRPASETAGADALDLRRLLEVNAPGRRVVDLGCGTGERAIGLAEAGFEVAGLDASAALIEEARRRGARAGVEVSWGLANLAGSFAWPLPDVDAAVFHPRSGWGKAADRRRLFRRLRSRLSAEAVLIAGCPQRPGGSFTSSPAQTSGESDREECACRTSSFERELREAGFAVQHADAGLSPGSPPPHARTAWLIARPLPRPPDTLAVTSWRNPEDVLLDLRYANDEAELLDPAPSRVWEEFVAAAPRHGADLAGSYAVDDPFGSERGAEVVSSYFGCPVMPRQLTFAAGVTSLLHDLCGLADGGLIVAPELVHADLGAWAVTRGVEFRPFPETAEQGRLMAEVEAHRPSLLHLDRPSFTGQVIPLDELEEVVRAASRVGALVLIDESAAPYLGPAASAVRLVSRADNLVVLRGFTKAYSWAGLRVGFAVASDAVGREVREHIAPLQVSEPGLHAAWSLLALGDVFGRLLKRIHLMKPAATALLKAAGFEVIEGHGSLPWVALSDVGGAASSVLARCKICPLRPATAPVFPRRPPAEVIRLTVPLSDERMSLFRQLLRGVGRRRES